MLRVERLVKRYGGVLATDDLSLEVAAGEIHAIIGPNGAGKTTLIRQLAGEELPDAGRIVFDGRDITHEPPHRRARAGIGRSYQITSVFPEFTALENVVLAVQAHAGHCFRFWRPVLRDPGLTDPATAALRQVGLADRGAVPAGELAHGERRQLEIAMTLATKPRLILLDEPMAGMSTAESADVVALLRTLARAYTVVLVEHDMDAVFALAVRITVLVYGRPIATGSVESIRSDPEVRAAYLGDDDGSVR